MRFCSGPWAAKGAVPHCFGEPFGDHFQPKIEKMHPKRHAKLDAEKVLKIDAKRLPKGCQNTRQNLRFYIVFKKDGKCKIEPMCEPKQDFQGSGHPRRHHKSIQEAYQIDAKKTWKK